MVPLHNGVNSQCDFEIVKSWIVFEYSFIGLGMSDPVGHIDFYPNNGEKQPGCKKSQFDQIIGGILDIGSIISGGTFISLMLNILS